MWQPPSNTGTLYLYILYSRTITLLHILHGPWPILNGLYTRVLYKLKLKVESRVYRGMFFECETFGYYAIYAIIYAYVCVNVGCRMEAI